MKYFLTVIICIISINITYYSVISQNNSEILRTEISPNLQWVIVTNNTGRIDLYDANGQFIHRFRESGDNVLAISWKSDSQYFVTGDVGGLVQIWDIINRNQLRQFPERFVGIKSISWNSLNSRIAVLSPGFDNSMRILDATIGVLLNTRDIGDSNNVVWQISQNIILTTSPLGLDIRNQEGVLVDNIATGYPANISINSISENVIALSIFRDYHYILVYNLEYRIKTFEKLLDNKEPIFKLSWSPDGTKLAASILNTGIIIWDYPSGILLQTITVPAILVPFYWKDNQTIQYYNNSTQKFLSANIPPVYTCTHNVPASSTSIPPSPTSTNTATNTPTHTPHHDLSFALVQAFLHILS